MARLLVDTSAVFALLDRSDANHTAAKRTLQQLSQRRVQPLLTNFIVAESHALALSRLGADLARRWLLANAWPVERVHEDDESKARTIIANQTDKTTISASNPSASTTCRMTGAHSRLHQLSLGSASRGSAHPGRRSSPCRPSSFRTSATS